jgi:hypothetical protein
MYRPTPRLAEVYPKVLGLSGAWPLFEHETLSAADGYLTDEYPCQVEELSFDSALLRCAGAPGKKYGFLNVNVEDPTGREAFMPWKHEIFEVGATDPLYPDFFDHYVKYRGEPAQNYHYFDTAQLLPLRSIPWPDGTLPRFLSEASSDLHGCHGTSGSGLLVRAAGTPNFALVGPASMAENLGDYLCNHVPGLDALATGPGQKAIAPEPVGTRTLALVHAGAIAEDCVRDVTVERDLADLPFEPGSHRVASLHSHLDCQPDPFARTGTVAAHPSLGPYREPYLDDPGSGEPHTIRGFSVEAGHDYRMALHVVPAADCSADCGAVTLRGGGTQAAFDFTSPEPAIATLAFGSSSSGPAELTVSNVGQERALGGFAFIREGQVNSFDAASDRLEAALYALHDEAGVVGPDPMRFTGDGVSGFAALLAPEERMALLRQALMAGRRWVVRLGADSYADLTCGLLGMDGEVVLREACSEVVRLDDRAGAEGRLGFFVELAAGATESRVLRYVAIASDQARNRDGDDVPDVLDNCPDHDNPSQRGCVEEAPAEPSSKLEPSGGCGCRVQGRSEPAGFWLALIALGIAVRRSAGAVARRPR